MASVDIEGGAGGAPAPQIAGFDGVEGGGAGEGGIDVPSAGSLSKMLFFIGTSAVALGIGALVKPPRGLWSRSDLLPLAYYAAGLVLNLFGMWLLKLSFAVAGNPNRRTVAKGVMCATLGAQFLVIAVHVLANPNISPSPLQSHVIIE